MVNEIINPNSWFIPFIELYKYYLGSPSKKTFTIYIQGFRKKRKNVYFFTYGLFLILVGSKLMINVLFSLFYTCKYEIIILYVLRNINA